AGRIGNHLPAQVGGQFGRGRLLGRAAVAQRLFGGRRGLGVQIEERERSGESGARGERGEHNDRAGGSSGKMDHGVPLYLPIGRVNGRKGSKVPRRTRRPIGDFSFPAETGGSGRGIAHEVLAPALRVAILWRVLSAGWSFG